MRAIFISYRREDSEGYAGRLADDLSARFGPDAVFMDVTTIELGRHFRRVIDENVSSCAVLLVAMGRNWIDAKDTAGRRRLDDPGDFVRLEIAAALTRDIPVVPVLVQGTRVPHVDQLPIGLKELAFRNRIELTHARWNSDFEVLSKALHRYIAEPTVTNSPASKTTIPGSPATTRIAGAPSASRSEAPTAPLAPPNLSVWMKRLAVVAVVTVIVLAAIWASNQSPQPGPAAETPTSTPGDTEQPASTSSSQGETPTPTVASPTFPTLTDHVADEAGILNSATVSALNYILGKHEGATGEQVVVVTLKSFQGHSMKDFDQQLFDYWGMKRNTGVLLILSLAPDGHGNSLGICSGTGLDGKLPAPIKVKILKNDVAFTFQRHDFNSAALAGAWSILAALRGSASAL